MRTRLFVLLFCISALPAFAQDSVFTVTSPAFKNNGMMPAKYSCEGKQISPPLHIANIPLGTEYIVITMHDPDAPIEGGFTHWVVWNIDTKRRKEMDIPENFTGGEQGLNGAGKKGYAGMCPPSGTHHYHFKVYALKDKLQLPPETNKIHLDNTLPGHIVAQSELIGLYQKTKH